MSPRRLRVAVVVQRYGEAVAGGSEALCRQVCEKLKDEIDLTVLTTTARDYVTWANEYPPGPDEVNGVRVRRFPTLSERDPISFRESSEKLFASPGHTLAEELRWVEDQGPYAPELLWSLWRDRDAYDATVFFTYLYYPTCFGLSVLPGRSILVPTAHNEPPAYLRIYKNLFRLPRRIFYNTPEERDFVGRLVPRNPVPGEVVGIGVEVPGAPDANGFRAKHRLGERPFVLYVGRVDRSKGCGEMFDYFQRFVAERKADSGSDLELVVVGEPVMPIPEHPKIRVLGFVPEEEKFAAIAASRLLILPSLFESLSIVVLEAWALGKPVLVNRGCEVVAGELARSGAGFAFGDYEGFAEALEAASRADASLGEMGERGRVYVAATHRWDKVKEAYLRAIREIAA